MRGRTTDLDDDQARGFRVETVALFISKTAENPNAAPNAFAITSAMFAILSGTSDWSISNATPYMTR